MKKLKIKKSLGVWYYQKITSNNLNDLDAPIYELYNANKEYIATFAYYGDMIYYLEEGVII